MKVSAIAIVLGAFVTLTTGVASAGEESGGTQLLFDDAGLGGKANPAVRAEVEAVTKQCRFEVMSREGPRESEVAKCEAAAARLSKRGVAAIGPILQALDRGNSSYAGTERLYDVLARSGDTRLVEPLIRAMARITTRNVNDRMHEVAFMEEALREITRAPVGEEIPWARSRARSVHDAWIDHVVDWRLWAADHEGKSHDDLVAERLADAREHAEEPDLARSYKAVDYLLRYAPAEGAAAAKKLVLRDDLPKEGKNRLDWEIRRASAEQPARKKAPANAKALLKNPSPKAAVPAKIEEPPSAKPTAGTPRS